MSIISEKYSFSVETTVSGFIFSDIAVNPRISVNKIVTFRSSPPRLSFASLSNNSSTTCFDTYLLKVLFTLLISEISSIAKTVPCRLPSGSNLGETDILITVSSDTVLNGIFNSVFTLSSTSDVVISSRTSSSFSKRYM